MSTIDETDLGAIVRGFVAGLPATIKSDILFFTLAYAFGEMADADTDLDVRVRVNLSGSPSPMLFGAVLRTTGALDFLTARFAKFAALRASPLKMAVQSVPPEMAEQLESALLGLPLRQRHFEAALASWTALRASTITPLALQDYEGRCLILPHVE